MGSLLPWSTRTHFTKTPGRFGPPKHVGGVKSLSSLHLHVSTGARLGQDPPARCPASPSHPRLRLRPSSHPRPPGRRARSGRTVMAAETKQCHSCGLAHAKRPSPRLPTAVTSLLCLAETRYGWDGAPRSTAAGTGRARPAAVPAPPPPARPHPCTASPLCMASLLFTASPLFTRVRAALTPCTRSSRSCC